MGSIRLKEALTSFCHHRPSRDIHGQRGVDRDVREPAEHHGGEHGGIS